MMLHTNASSPALSLPRLSALASSLVATRNAWLLPVPELNTKPLSVRSRSTPRSEGSSSCRKRRKISSRRTTPLCSMNSSVASHSERPRSVKLWLKRWVRRW